ncbi:hypothetical protein R84B8_01227 [Treponema sp. R8-4-B8]
MVYVPEIMPVFGSLGPFAPRFTSTTLNILFLSAWYFTLLYRLTDSPLVMSFVPVSVIAPIVTFTGFVMPDESPFTAFCTLLSILPLAITTTADITIKLNPKINFFMVVLLQFTLQGLLPFLTPQRSVFLYITTMKKSFFTPKSSFF